MTDLKPYDLEEIERGGNVAEELAYVRNGMAIAMEAWATIEKSQEQVKGLLLEAKLRDDHDACHHAKALLDEMECVLEHASDLGGEFEERTEMLLMPDAEPIEHRTLLDAMPW